MITLATIFAIALILFVFLYRTISLFRVKVCAELRHEQKQIQAWFEAQKERKRELAQELAEKEQLLASLRANHTGYKGISIEALSSDEADDNDKASRHLLSKGLISLEQNESALKKMSILKMDFLSVCMALGYIDLETSRKIKTAINQGSIK